VRGNPERLRAVAKVAPNLADDGRDGVGGQRRAAARVVPVDGLDQADRPDLDEILELLPTANEATRERSHQRQMRFDQLPSRLEVSPLVPGGQEQL
jgi:hypothetical protein